MTQRMQDLAHEIVRLQAELDREIEGRRRALGVEIAGRIVGFERGVLKTQRRLRVSVGRIVAESELVSWLTAPMIYSLISSSNMATLTDIGHVWPSFAMVCAG